MSDTRKLLQATAFEQLHTVSVIAREAIEAMDDILNDPRTRTHGVTSGQAERLQEARDRLDENLP